jgi:sialate O-acetylesterase
MKLKCLLLSIVFSLPLHAQAPVQLRLPALFSDNMVLQQNARVPVWGQALPGAHVSVQATWGAEAATTVLANGNWSVNLKTMKAGGPYELRINTGDTAIICHNVLLGEVWLCSGQSNMEMPLEGWLPDNYIKDSEKEIKAANHPTMRLFTVARAISDTPEFQCAGNWQVCSSASAAKFSATAFFFGRTLQEHLQVPVGLIVSSWGGTKIQSWIDANHLEAFAGYKDIISKIKASVGDAAKLNRWIRSHKIVKPVWGSPGHEWENLDFEDAQCAAANFDDRLWKTMQLPGLWENEVIGDFDGIVWFRKSVTLPESWKHKDLILSLGPIDDMDRTYVNGTLVGRTEQSGMWQQVRVYKVSGNLVSAANLTIAVRVLDNGGGGGVWGTGKDLQVRLADSSAVIALGGDWKYLPSAEFTDNQFYVYPVLERDFENRPKVGVSIGPNTPTMLYNAMIAPLIPYAIKGAIWYQGESNSDIPAEYRNYDRLLACLIDTWRSNWHEPNFPFLFAQIAPFGYGENAKSFLIRDAERKTLTTKNTGMAVLMDVGDSISIHPPDKQSVGFRLASWALARTYKKKLCYSGPLYKSMKQKDGTLEISFNHAGKSLVLKPGYYPDDYVIAGADKKFYPADVQISGNKLILSSQKVAVPVAARYGWKNFVSGSLFNAEGLPAASFRTDDWDD